MRVNGCLESIRPQTTKLSEIEGMLSSMSSFEIGKANYIACPITGGPLYVDLIKSSSNQIPKNELQSLVERNIERANEFCSFVRERTGRVCINPAVLHREHWNQDDYRHFWSRVVELFAERVILSSGWELSSGCLFECLLAIHRELPLLDHNLAPLDYNVASEAALNGIMKLNEVGDKSSFLRLLADEFQNFARCELTNGPT